MVEIVLEEIEMQLLESILDQHIVCLMENIQELEAGLKIPHFIKLPMGEDYKMRLNEIYLPQLEKTNNIKEKISLKN